VCSSDLAGLAPVVVYLGGPWYLAFFTAAAALLAWGSGGKGVQAVEGYRPGLIHYAVAAQTSLCLWGLLGVVWFGLYGMAYWVFRLVVWVASVVKIASNARAPWEHTWAFYVSMVFAAFVGLAVATSSSESMTRLLHAEGLRYVRRSKALLCWALLLGAIVAVLVGLRFAGPYFAGPSGERAPFLPYLILQFVPYIFGLPALTIEKSGGKKNESVEAVCRLFESAGYEVIRSPRSPDSFIDPVLSKLDLLASRGKRLFAVEVKTTDDSTEPVDWSAASSLLTRVRALEYSYNEHWAGTQDEDVGAAISDRRVEPLIVLVGRKQDESFAEFTRAKSFPVVELKGEVLQQVAETRDPERLKEIARESLQAIEAPHAVASSAS